MKQLFILKKKLQNGFSNVGEVGWGLRSNAA